MKRATIVRSLLAIAWMVAMLGAATTELALTGCSSDDTAGSSASVDPGDGSDFSGTYVLRAQDCEPYDGILEFTVVQSGTDLTITITKVEGDVWAVDDIIDGIVLESGSDFLASIPELLCLAKLMLTEEEIDEIKSLTGLDVQIGDLDAFCNDESPDFFCTVIFQHKSS